MHTLSSFALLQAAPSLWSMLPGKRMVARRRCQGWTTATGGSRPPGAAGPPVMTGAMRGRAAMTGALWVVPGWVLTSHTCCSVCPAVWHKVATAPCQSPLQCWPWEGLCRLLAWLWHLLRYCMVAALAGAHGLDLMAAPVGRAICSQQHSRISSAEVSSTRPAQASACNKQRDTCMPACCLSVLPMRTGAAALPAAASAAAPAPAGTAGGTGTSLGTAAGVTGGPCSFWLLRSFPSVHQHHHGNKLHAKLAG